MLEITQISQVSFDRWADLRRRVCLENRSLRPWSDDRTAISYRENLARGEISVWVACREGQDLGYAWFQVNQGEFTLREIAARMPGYGDRKLYGGLIAAGLDWVRRQRGRACRYRSQAGDPALAGGLQACGFNLESEHILMGASLDAAAGEPRGLTTRTFAEIGDASGLLHLIERCMGCTPAYDRQDILDVIRRSDDLSLVAWRDGQGVGFLMGEIHSQPGANRGPSQCYVAEIGVLPEYRRQGCATHLLAECFSRAWRQGLREARLHVLADNPAGLGLYHRLGFVEVERVGWWEWGIPDC